jgi:hypothetical protein
LIHGKIKSAGAIVSDNLMNDAEHLKEIKDQDERDAVLEQDEIVYIPILRYASVEGFPGIHDLNKFIKEQDSTLATELFGDTKIFAIKNSYANDLIKKGYNLISFNKFFKERLEKLYENKFKDLAEYNGLTEHARSEYNKSQKGSDYHYYNYGSIDKQFMFHILNLLGLEYGEYIKDKELVSLMDQCMTLEFFADTIYRSSFDIQKFKAADYFAHITKLLHNIGLNGINSKDIRQNNILYNSLIRWIATFYESHSEQESMVKLIKPDYSLKDKLPKVDELRNSIKEALDKQPMLKYIVCSQECRGDLRELRSTNPLNFGSGNSYYSKKSSWSTKFDNVDKFKELIGNSII